MRDICNTFEGKRVLIIGDAVADQFLNGEISRVSREAPVFILRHEQTVTLPGAAANAAANVATLGGTAVLLGFVGDDLNGEMLRRTLVDAGVVTSHLITVPGSTTPTKLRVLAGTEYAIRQQVIRIDYEPSSSIDERWYGELIGAVHEHAAQAAAIIVSDYGYETVGPEVFEAISSVAGEHKIPVVVDSRRRLLDFAGATTATPNREEVEQIFGHASTEDECSSLRERLGLETLLVTDGSRGMTLYQKDHHPVAMPVVGSKEPVDVTGAGDAVVAAYTLALSAGASYGVAAEIANHAGGIAVMKKGTGTVSRGELLQSIGSAEAASSSSHMS